MAGEFDRTGASSWESLGTEARHPESSELDRLETEQIVHLLLAEDQQGLEATAQHAPAIARAAQSLAETYASGGTILLLGAGTSGRLGVIEAAECPPTFGTDPDRIRAAIAGGAEAVFRAAEGTEDRANNGAAAVSELGHGDLLIAISASSVTPYVRGALTAARPAGVNTILLTCAAESDELTELADQMLALDTGPEVLAGSTRLKAGSVTKAVLNAVTTAAMVRLGKVYQNLMVDLVPGSAKLRDRAIRILMAATEASRDESVRLLHRADGEVKTAIVMAAAGVDATEARAQLKSARGAVRGALEGADLPPRQGASK